MRERLEDKEKLLESKEKEVVSLTSLQSQNSGEVDVLNTLIQSKEKQISSLKDKVRIQSIIISSSFDHELSKVNLIPNRNPLIT